MAVWFVSRHPGAIAWAKKQNLPITNWTTHIDINQIQKNDTVIGTLPIQLAANVCARGARFYALTLNLNENQRGRDLSEKEMDKVNCSLKQFEVKAI